MCKSDFSYGVLFIITDITLIYKFNNFFIHFYNVQQVTDIQYITVNCFQVLSQSPFMGHLSDQESSSVIIIIHKCNLNRQQGSFLLWFQLRFGLKGQ